MLTYSARDIQLDPGIWTKTSQIQLLYGVWVTLTYLAIGLAFGFTSIQVPQLLSTDSEIPITRNDASWIASILHLFCPIGSMTSGFVMDRFGRRIMLIFSQVAMLIGWLYTSLANTPKQLILARAIIGVGCGMATSPPRIYCTEISLPNIRGVLGAFPNVALSIGMSVQAALGKFLHWKLVCYVCCIFTFVNSCSYTLLPETPYFILKTKTTADARANLAKFRGPQYSLDKEMDQLIDFKQFNNIRKLTLVENMGALLSKASCKPFCLIVIYVFIGQLAGNSAIMFWPVELLTEANSSVDVYAGNILVNLTRVFMAIITSILLYRVGRRPMALTSAIGLAIVCFTIGAFLMYYDEPSVLPLVCFILYNVFGSLGYYSLPHLMAYELFPLQVRGILGGALVTIHSLILFATTNVQPFVMDFLGVDNMFITFGGFSLVGIVYLYFFLPETRELTLQEIEEYYKEIRPTLVSQRRSIISQLATQVSPRTESNLLKVNREASSLMSSKTSILAKLEAQRQLAILKRGSSTELDSFKRSNSSGSNKSKDSKESRKDGKSKEPKGSGNDGKETPKDKDEASTSKKNTQ